MHVRFYLENGIITAHLKVVREAAPDGIVQAVRSVRCRKDDDVINLRDAVPMLHELRLHLVCHIRGRSVAGVSQEGVHFVYEQDHFRAHARKLLGQREYRTGVLVRDSKPLGV